MPAAVSPGRRLAVPARTGPVEQPPRPARWPEVPMEFEPAASTDRTRFRRSPRSALRERFLHVPCAAPVKNLEVLPRPNAEPVDPPAGDVLRPVAVLSDVVELHPHVRVQEPVQPEPPGVGR